MKKIELTLSILLSLVIIAKYSIGTASNQHAAAKLFTIEDDSMRTAAKIEENSIRKYIADHNLQASKTPSGLYYVVENKGNGKKVKPGKKVTVNYTGSLLSGKVFDSSIDTSFHHPESFTFIIGQGQVIKGWDEGIALFNVGGKGKLIIPSALAYGEKGTGEVIPPNTPLIFDIEVLNVSKGK